VRIFGAGFLSAGCLDFERARWEGLGRHLVDSEERSCSTSSSSPSGSVRRFLCVWDDKPSPLGLEGERERLDVEGSDRALFV
jgi:hypothetical protein